jgi:hypothetical protein
MAVERICKCCGAKFSAKAADVQRGWALFCSKHCKATNQARAGGGTRYLADRNFDDEADPSWGEHEIWDTRP